MSFNGIDQITYGVDDLSRCEKFFSDWGLRRVTGSPTSIEFATQDGTQVIIKRLTDRSLPEAFEAGPTVREVIWGISSTQAHQTLAQRLSLPTDADGICRCLDPNGLTLGFRVSQRNTITAEGAQINSANNITRINRRAPVYDKAEPIGIGHLVVFTDQLDTLESFYCNQFGFQVSDRYPGRGVFLRCQPEGGHHNLFLLQLPTGKVGLNHVAFIVRDIHEVFGGGLHVSRCGWETELGPGRHPISSAYFWYVKSPAGGTVEYYADEDYLTGEWQAQEFIPSNEMFAEWAIDGGIDGNTRRQK